MIKRISTTLIMALLICCASFAASAATLSPTLQSKLGQLADSASVGLVIVAFNTSGLNDSHLGILKGVGISDGIMLKQLGMVAVPATAGQVKTLAGNSAVRSIWSNDRLYYHLDQARVLAGVDKLRRDDALISANGNLPVTGMGNFSVVINDSGIDATHNDLKFGSHVIQNVQVLTDKDTGTTCTDETGCIIGHGFTQLQVAENMPNTDSHVGHGTHCAGIVGGTGQQSSGRYSGVAPGAKLIGLGSGAGLFILNALGGYEWVLTNYFTYNIKIVSNSWGSPGAFNPDNPIHIATKEAYDLRILSVFSSSNNGPGPDTHNSYGKAPWVISVAAGTKEGGLANFSSRGTPKEQRLADNDPNNDNDAPSITAPGTGREFAGNLEKFTSDIVSTRSSSNAVANGFVLGSEVGTDAFEIPPAYLPFYTEISGTSMACPFVAGVAALMLDADPNLKPAEIKDILLKTATRMPGREDYEVGAGYVNAYAAVDKVFNRSRNYGALVNPSFNTELTAVYGEPETFEINYTPQTPGPGSTNTYRFTVEPGKGILDVRIDFGNNAATAEAGNSMGLQLYPPGCVAVECGYSSGLTLPALDSPRREIIVKNPPPGEWVAEIRGLRGLAAAPVSAPVGIAVPERVDGLIKQAVVTMEEPSDIQGHVGEQQIRSVLNNRMMDTFADNSFKPDANVTRGDFARILALNTPLRQRAGAAPKFTDVSGDLAPIAEAVTAKGSTLRDYYTDSLKSTTPTPAGMMNATGTLFNPDGLVSRLDMAVALVRALGLDAEAKAKTGQDVTTTYDAGNGQTQVLTLADNAQIPLDLRGYVQIALDKGILQAFFTLEQGPFDRQPVMKARVKPSDPTSRASMAYALDFFRQRFVSGT